MAKKKENSKQKYENIMVNLQNQFIARMRKAGYMKLGLASYGEAKDLVMMFQDKDSDLQYYVSCAALRRSVENHTFKAWSDGVIAEAVKDKKEGVKNADAGNH